MATIVRTWSELAALADEFRTKDWIFRGVEINDEHKLIPKIGRPGTRGKVDGTTLPFSPAAEGKMLERFKREARTHLRHEPRSDFEWLSIAQHHGLATRLLDWSESPLVAAYFAVKQAGIVLTSGKKLERVDAAIYGVKCPKRLAYKASLKGKYGGMSQSVAAYYPPHLTTRITAQRGLFTIHKAPSKEWKPEGLRKWVIPSNNCMRLKLALSKAGLNQASLFPDLDGLAVHVGWLYKWGIIT